MISGASAQTAEDVDRDALSDARRRYSELIDQGHFRAALNEAGRVYKLSKAMFPEGDRQLATATFNYGKNLLWLTRHNQLLWIDHHRDSGRILKKALKRYDRFYGKTDSELIPVLLAMAAASGSPPEFRPNRRYLNRAREIAASNFEPLSIENADAMLAIAEASFFNPPSVATGEDIRKAYDIYQDTLDPLAFKIGKAAYALARYHGRRKEFEVAEQFLQQALTIFDPYDEARLNMHIEARLFMVSMLDRRGSRSQATSHMVAIGKIFEGVSIIETRALVRVAPVYPPAAARAGHTGYVDFQFTVDEQGLVTAPEVIKFTGDEDFVEAAIEALMRFRFAPLFVDGQAVAQPGMTTRITFNIQN